MTRIETACTVQALAGALVLGSLVAGAARAQSPADGDCVVLGHQVGPVALDVSWFSHDGKQGGGLFSSLSHSGGGGLTAAPLNDGILFTCVFNRSAPTERLYHVDRWGKVNSLGPLSSLFVYVPTILVDQTGDLLLLNMTKNAAAGGIYRKPMIGGRLTTVVTGLANPVAMEEDLVTGDFLVADGSGNVHRVTRQGTITSVVRGAFPGNLAWVRSGMHTHFRDGTLLAPWGNRVFRFDPRTGAVTTLVSSGAVTYLGLDHDPIHGGFYRLDSNALVRYDPDTGRTTTIRQPWAWLYGPAQVATWGSRILTGQGPARPGLAYPIHLGLFSEAGRAYQAAASFGTLAGIPTPAGRIPLDPDPLLFLSVRNPILFPGFAGFLSRSGTARLTVNLPGIPALRGVRFYVAAVTYAGGGIRRISEPLGVLIE